jgi:AraC family transcriptional regulator, regulatory protein of adaptative response / DNA-3-methyladenine glycosylase II
VCPARMPKAGNCLFLPSAAAAEAAGFRPCLRCRPEIAPELDAWRAHESPISRALALIEAGALDDGRVDDLAGRVGVGTRHLRRLFQHHLGASPVAVAQTRRALLAQRLVRETDMSMVDIAMASGFGSVRRFNESFHARYGCAPGALRRARGRPAGTAATALEILLPYKAPYAWDALLAFLRARAIPGIETVGDGLYQRTFALNEASGVLSVRNDAAVGALRVRVRCSRLSALPAILARLRRQFDLATDPVAIASALSTDPQLAPLLAARPGLRVPGAWSGFEVAVRAILGQQITVTAASRLAARLVAAFGTPVEGEDGSSRAFPEPAALAEADVASLGMPRARAGAITALARAAAGDERLFEPGRGLDEAVAALCALPGIGVWTAQYIAMRVLRESDAFPSADIGLLRAMTPPGGTRPTPAVLAERAEAWRPWRAYAAIHLWTADAQAGSGGKPTAHARGSRRHAVAA